VRNRQPTCSLHLSDGSVSLHMGHSIHLYSPISKIMNLPQGFTICTHTTSLTFDLTSDQEKQKQKRKKLFQGEKVNNPSGEQQRRIPLQDGQNTRCHVMQTELKLMDYLFSHMGICVSSTQRHVPSRVGCQKPVPMWYRFQYNRCYPTETQRTFRCLSRLKMKKTIVVNFSGDSALSAGYEPLIEL